MFYRPAPNFAVNFVHKFRPNVVGYQLAMGERQWYIMGCYIAPDKNSTIDSVVAALKERTCGAKLLMAGDFNTQILEPEGDRRGEEIAATLATERIKDMSEHFLLRRSSWCLDRRTWSMIRAGREVRYQTDYILGMDRRLFWNVSVREPRHNSDNYGLPPQRPPEGILQIPQEKKAAPPPTTDHPDEGGQNICGPTEGSPKASGAGRKEKRVNLGGHVDTRRRESLRAPISRKGPVLYLEVGLHNRGKLEGIQETSVRGSGRGGGDTTWFGPPPPPGSLAPVEGVVLVCGRLCSATRSGNSKAYQGGSGGPLRLRSTPGG